MHQFEPTSAATQTWMYSLYSEMLCSLTRSNLYYPWIQQEIDLVWNKRRVDIVCTLGQLYDYAGHADWIGRVWEDAIMHRLAEEAQPGGLQIEAPDRCWGWRLQVADSSARVRVLLLKYKLRWGPTTVAVFDIKTINTGKSKVFSHW